MFAVMMPAYILGCEPEVYHVYLVHMESEEDLKTHCYDAVEWARNPTPTQEVRGSRFGGNYPDHRQGWNPGPYTWELAP